MYAVTCSSCSHVEKSLFARVGAVMVCPACKAKVPLRHEDLKRQFKVRIDGDEELFRVPVAAKPEEDAAAALAGAMEASVSLAVQPLPPLEAQADPAELAADAESRAEALRRRKPRTQSTVTPGHSLAHAVQRRQTRTTALVTSFALLAGVVILAVVFANSGKTPSTNEVVHGNGKDGEPSTPAGTKDSAAVIPPTTDGDKDGKAATKDGGPLVTPANMNKDKDKTKVLPDVPKPATLRIAASPVGADDWQSVNEAYHVGPVTDQVVLINDSREKQQDGGQLFKAEVVSQGVASARVTVALVNDEDRVYARFEQSLFLIDGKKARPVQLAIPPELIGSATSICWEVVPIDTHVRNPTLLDDSLAELIKGEGDPVIRVSAYNSGNLVLKDAAFVIEGVDGGGLTAGQWRLRYPMEVGARTWVKFEAQLPPTNLKRISSWRVLAAGLPVGGPVPEVVAPVPAPPERDPRKSGLPPRRGLFE